MKLFPRYQKKAGKKADVKAVKAKLFNRMPMNMKANMPIAKIKK